MSRAHKDLNEALNSSVKETDKNSFRRTRICQCVEISDFRHIPKANPELVRVFGMQNLAGVNSMTDDNTKKEKLLGNIALFGKPPVLSSEDEKQFSELFHHVADCVKPQNMVEMIYLWHFDCATWLINRYTRHMTVAIERFAKQNREFRTQRAKLREQRQSAQVSREIDKLTGSPADVAQLVQLEGNHEDMVRDTDAIYAAADLERDHNKALQQSIALHEQLNALIVAQTRIRDESLRQLELFRKGLGSLAKETTESILARQADEHHELPTAGDAPSIAPSDDEGAVAPATSETSSENGGA
jgi:hypothetical protein